MQVLIVEDEELAAERLERLLKRLEPETEVMATLDSVNHTIEWLQDHKPDLLFLDIHLSDGSGFEIFDHVKMDIPVIFTTAYDQYAIDAFKVNSIDYLLKPIKKAELQRSLDQYKKLYEQTQKVQEQLQTLLTSFQGQGADYKKRLLVYVGDKLKSIPVSRIAYCFAQNKMVFLRLFDGTELPIDYSLDQLESMLNPEQFFRINRQLLIQFEAIQGMHQYSKGRVKIDLNPPYGDLVIVSVERSKAFKDWLEG